MARLSSIVLLSTLFSLQAWCETPEDSWISPSAPNWSTNLTNGEAFTIHWNTTDIPGSISTYCTDCDAQQVDLWVASGINFDNAYKIFPSIDVTDFDSYEWTVDIPTDTLAAEAAWVFCFVAKDAEPPFSEAVLSPVVGISDPDASTTTSTTSSPTTSSTTDSTSSSSSPTPTTSAMPSSSPPPPPSNNDAPKSESRSKVWLAGVVAGPIVGIALGAALVWFLLGRRKKRKQGHDDHSSVAYIKAQQASPIVGYAKPPQPPSSAGYVPAGEIPELMSGEEVEQKKAQTGVPPATYQDQAPVEAAEREPAELWHGNYGP